MRKTLLIIWSYLTFYLIYIPLWGLSRGFINIGNFFAGLRKDSMYYSIKVTPRFLFNEDVNKEEALERAEKERFWL